MNILWVKAGGLLPANTGGRSRSYNLLRYLTQRHSVSVFTFYGTQADDAHSILSESFSRVRCLSMDLPGKGGLSGYALYGWSLISMQPYSLAKYRKRSVAKQLRFFYEESCDVIVCDFLFSASVIPWDVSCAKVLFAHNVEAEIWQRHCQVADNPLWRAVCWREWQLMARAERRYARKADAVLTVSDADRKVFAEFIHPDKIAVVPTGVDTEYFQPAPEEEEPNYLLFTGSMDWLANEDAMGHFARKILPLIEHQIPDVSLWIVGRSPTQQIQDLPSRNKNIHVTGTVEDVRPYMRKAAVYVVPIRVGSGTRLKIFEAMAMGKPVASTPIGAEGLPVNDGKDILLAKSDEDFAEAVIGLLRDRGRRRSLGLAARNLVQTKYSWAAAAAIFEDSLTRSVQGSRRSETP